MLLLLSFFFKQTWNGNFVHGGNFAPQPRRSKFYIFTSLLRFSNYFGVWLYFFFFYYNLLSKLVHFLSQPDRAVSLKMKLRFLFSRIFSCRREFRFRDLDEDLLFLPRATISLRFVGGGKKWVLRSDPRTGARSCLCGHRFENVPNILGDRFAFWKSTRRCPVKESVPLCFVSVDFAFNSSWVDATMLICLSSVLSCFLMTMDCSLSLLIKKDPVQRTSFGGQEYASLDLGNKVGSEVTIRRTIGSSNSF